MSSICSLLLILHCIVARCQFNLHLTDGSTNTALEHDCLHLAAFIKTDIEPRQIIAYCLSEWPSKWNVQPNSLDRSFSFDQLFERDITSEQLYRWSAPIDLAESYQSYLDHLPTSKQWPSQSFYNCTAPRFGPRCQYSFDGYESYALSLSDIVRHFYSHPYAPKALTCFTQLQCDHSSRSGCLDWTDVCNGEIDCLNDGIDEKDCWQLQINECDEENQFRCDNGECIAKTFVADDVYAYECIDRSDELKRPTTNPQRTTGEPTFALEDMRCPKGIENEMTLRSKCPNRRDNLNIDALFSDQPKYVNEECWFAFRCHFSIPLFGHPRCRTACIGRSCQQIINETCPDVLFIPDVPLLFGHIYFAYTKQAAVEALTIVHPPSYVCYDEQLCSGFLPNKTLVSFHNTTCRRPADFPLKFTSVLGRNDWFDRYVKAVYRELYKCNTVTRNISAVCDNSKMYRCMNSSKCIPNDRLGDNRKDCDYGDDEEQTVIDAICLEQGSTAFFNCTTTGKCINRKKVENTRCDCGRNAYGLCDDEDEFMRRVRTHISFPLVCDGFTELLPVTIDGKNETDETECELWHCNNTYTRCDGFWNCLNGADEVDCDPSPLLECPMHSHVCISPHTQELMCLPLARANDGSIDCLGGTDEPRLCRSQDHAMDQNNFFCPNRTYQRCVPSINVCFEAEHCPDNDDRKELCSQTNDLSLYTLPYKEWCSDPSTSDMEMLLCDFRNDDQKVLSIPFSLHGMEKLPSPSPDRRLSTVQITVQHQQRCHRGLPLRVWSGNERNSTNTTCLCPPSFYGDMCQFQNQRISLTIKLQAYSDSRRTPFAVVVTLIDDTHERIIHSHHQLTYLYIRDCQIKFNIYLLYASRPKNLTNSHSVHIDVYEKSSLAYRGSLILPLQFPFLPIHRIALHLDVPRASETCRDERCVHGQCMQYFNAPAGTTFCQCHEGWSGRYCTIPHTCLCSDDALCLGFLAGNRSLCVCRLHTFGPRCLLRNPICLSASNATCYNGGQCIPVDESMVIEKKFFCLCPKRFTGERCEIPDVRIIVSFHEDIALSQSMMVHFIEVLKDAPPRNGSTFVPIAVNQKSAIVHWARPFHIAIAQLLNGNYYIIVVQRTYNQSITLEQRIHLDDRCPHVSEVFNGTIAELHPLRRIKYYHLACRQSSSHLACFYDESHFCLCEEFSQDRPANCFEFNYMNQFDCYGRSNCQNGAKCLQDQSICPQTSMCVCQPCFYGGRCQFSSNGFDLLLDGILGYHIQPHVNLVRQPAIVQVSVMLTLVMIVVGLVDGFLSLTTFKSKELRQMGCGLYLLGSSITTLFVTVMLAVKCSILIIAQMNYISHRPFLHVQCLIVDYLLRTGVHMDQWLNACVAIDRAVTVLKGAAFDKKTSKRVATCTILLLLAMTIGTAMHDPFHRSLLDEGDDDEQKRIWCTVSYSARFHVLNSFMNMFHFFAPFVINVTSAVVIIRATARLRTRIQTHRSYRELLREQFRQHQHLLIAPIVLSILAVPRLIISFVSGCMKSSDDAWLFLVGYYVSFMPSMLTFAVFVLPSTSYKSEFRKDVDRYRAMIRSLAQRMSSN